MEEKLGTVLVDDSTVEAAGILIVTEGPPVLKQLALERLLPSIIIKLVVSNGVSWPSGPPVLNMSIIWVSLDISTVQAVVLAPAAGGSRANALPPGIHPRINTLSATVFGSHVIERSSHWRGVVERVKSFEVEIFGVVDKQPALEESLMV